MSSVLVMKDDSAFSDQGFFHNNFFFYSSLQKVVILFDLQTQRQTRVYDAPCELRYFAVSPDGQHILMCCVDRMYVFEVDSGHCINSYVYGETCYSMTFVAKDEIILTFDKGSMCRRKYLTGDHVMRYESNELHPIGAVVIDNNTSVFYTGDDHGNFVRWNIQSHKPVEKICQFKKRIIGLNLMQPRHMIVTFNEDKVLVVTLDEEIPDRICIEKNSYNTCVTATPSGKYICVGSGDCKVRIVRSENGKGRALINLPDVARSISISKDGSFFSITTWKGVRVMKADTLFPDEVFDSHKRSISNEAEDASTKKIRLTNEEEEEQKPDAPPGNVSNDPVSRKDVSDAKSSFDWAKVGAVFGAACFKVFGKKHRKRNEKTQGESSNNPGKDESHKLEEEEVESMKEDTQDNKAVHEEQQKEPQSASPDNNVVVDTHAPPTNDQVIEKKDPVAVPSPPPRRIMTRSRTRNMLKK